MVSIGLISYQTLHQPRVCVQKAQKAAAQCGVTPPIPLHGMMLSIPSVPSQPHDAKLKYPFYAKLLLCPLVASQEANQFTPAVYERHQITGCLIRVHIWFMKCSYLHFLFGRHAWWFQGPGAAWTGLWIPSTDEKLKKSLRLCPVVPIAVPPVEEKLFNNTEQSS